MLAGRVLPLAALVVIGASVVACGNDGPQSDAERFCGEAAERRDQIVSPPLGSDEEVEATLEFYRLMGRLAPLSISEQWNDLVVSLETASTMVPGDAESEQEVALRAYATERSAYEVAEWLRERCGVDIGPITTIAPQADVPARTTTTLPTDGSTPAGSTPGTGTPGG